MTCKKKRLKCDETHPTCQQCHKRGVTCEGYKKDFKWRTFEETTFASKPMTRLKKAANNQSRSDGPIPSPETALGEGHGAALPKPTTSVACKPMNEREEQEYQAASQPGIPYKHSDYVGTPFQLPRLEPNLTFDLCAPGLPIDSPSFPEVLNSAVATSEVPITSHTESPSPGVSVKTFSSDSPGLGNILQAGAKWEGPAGPFVPRPLTPPTSYDRESSDRPAIGQNTAVEEDFDEEIIRRPTIAMESTGESASDSWCLRLHSPAASESSNSSRSSGLTIYAQPRLSASSPEMLMSHFDHQTCGILSVKDGPTENPWRTLIWPLAKDSPALYHAIFSMTAFHGSKEIPGMRVPGVAHMTKSIKHLANEISSMDLDAALATSLALAFSEGWDEHISTGIRHLKGAKVMVNSAVVRHRNNVQSGRLDVQEATRLKFLCNTFIYMDVIARLTSLEEDNQPNLDEILDAVNMPMGDFIEVDPLMGCASTLFPLIGRVANLIQKVRKTQSNSLALVSQANDLKQLIIQWQVPNIMLFERPEDPDSEVQHSIQTAEAYRLATLLYLHQAVPEIPSEPAPVLAKQILMTIASVPLSSRTTIVQIFPLLAASCEVTTQEDRNWVIDRWLAMMARLKIGNVDSCFHVVQEVWKRRDLFEEHRANRILQRYTSRGLPNGGFVSPMLSNSKRKAQTMDMGEGFHSQETLGNDGVGNIRNPGKRRMTFDCLQGPPSLNLMPSQIPPPLLRRTSDLASNNIEPEYTVRGPLHWVRVMQDWDWEGISLSSNPLIKHSC